MQFSQIHLNYVVSVHGGLCVDGDGSLEVNGCRVCRLLGSWETLLVILSGQRSSPQAVIGMFTQLPSALSRRRMVSGSVTPRPRSEYMFNLVRKLWERCENDLSARREDAGHIKCSCKIKINSRAADTMIEIHAESFLKPQLFNSQTVACMRNSKREFLRLDLCFKMEFE